MDIPLKPPKEWFDKPSTIPTDKRLTVEDSGRVYGYVALWDTCHAGLPGCVKPPKGSPSGYGFAHQGETVTSDGTVIATANIGGGGHASIKASPEAAAAHYQEHTSTQLMRVKYGEDENGLWFAGSLWPDVSDVDIAHIRSSAVSGDWRWFSSWRSTDGEYDFAGSCFVNIPGYPVNAGKVSESSGKMYSIAASLSAFMPGTLLQDNHLILSSHDPYHKGEDMSENTCPCGEKPKDECPSDCDKKNVTASVEEIVQDVIDDVVEEVVMQEVEQPKLENETSNDQIASLGRNVEELSTRLISLEEKISQLVAARLAEKLAQ